MAETFAELTIDYEENGIKLVKQLDKQVLSKGAWTTIIYKYQDWNKSQEEYGPVKFTIRRYRKINGRYKKQTKFNISSIKQAGQIVEILSEWLNE